MSDIHVIMLHLVRSRAVIDRCAKVIEPEDFSRPGEQFCGMIWDISRKWCEKNPGTIPQTYIDMEITSQLLPIQQEFSDAEIRGMYELIAWIYSRPDDTIAIEHAMAAVQRFMDDRRVKPLALEMANASPDVFDEALSKMHIEHAKTRLAARGSIDGIFTPGGFYVGKTPRQPTGVAFVDELFNGGTSPGELYGCIAPTGGGKTTLGCMLFSEIAKQGRHVAFFSYETEFAPQVTNSIYCYMAGLPRGSLDRFSKEDIDPEHRKAIEAELTKYGGYMHGFDMKKSVGVGVGCGGISEIDAELQTCKNKGMPIEFIVIDQMLSLVDSYVTKSSNEMNLRREYMQLFVEQIRDLCSRHHCCALILHQADNKFKMKKPHMKPPSNGGYAAEDKSFENNMHFCLGMGTRDKTVRMSWLLAIKHREGPGGEIVIEMDKDIPRINWDKEKFRYDSSTKSFIKLDDDGAFADPTRDISSVHDIDTNSKEEGVANVEFETTQLDDLG